MEQAIQNQIEITSAQKVILNRLQAKFLLAEAEAIEAQLQQEHFIIEISNPKGSDEDGK